jgi:CheY-like chemotaxis protein
VGGRLVTDPRSPAGATVLIVEDHADTREMYVELLMSVGLSTIDVDTADQALDVSKKSGPRSSSPTYDSELARTA